MKLHAISDIHVGYAANRAAIQRIPDHGHDWLIVAGDVSETLEDLEFALRTLKERFAKLIWIPGNHELWTTPCSPTLRGEAKYLAAVALCRSLDVATPEDPYLVWPGDGPAHLLVPMFLLYDYSFGPDGLDVRGALDWARESGIECVDEHLLHSAPYRTKAEWCAARCRYTELRIQRALGETPLPTVLINHFPLLAAHAVLPRVPRFSIWCGTRKTTNWPTRYGASVVVYGHLHIPRSHHDGGTRFEEVSLGYPAQWERWSGTKFMVPTVRQILPLRTL